MMFVTITYCATGALSPAPVEPALLGNHLPVTLDCSKHSISSRTEAAAENEALIPPDDGLLERKLLQVCVRGSWVSAWLKEANEATELGPAALRFYPPPNTPIQQLLKPNTHHLRKALSCRQLEKNYNQWTCAVGKAVFLKRLSVVREGRTV